MKKIWYIAYINVIQTMPMRTYTYKYAAKLVELVPEFQADLESHNFPEDG